MLIFISGGVRSGKSALGEKLVSRYSGEGRKVYLATSEAYDDEMVQRIAKHREDRAGKGFVTIEKSRGIATVAAQLQKGDAVLLDCLGTLAANEMFGEAYVQTSTATVDALAETIFGGIMALNGGASALIVISNEVFSDGCDYDGMTLDYVKLLGLLHRKLAGAADAAVECACGCYIVHKGTIEGEWS